MQLAMKCPPQVSKLSTTVCTSKVLRSVVPHQLRLQLPNLIPGTPNLGTREILDGSYYMRSGKEAHDFFKVGRVFAMLWAEAASETASRSQIRFPSNATNNSDITVGPFVRGRFGQRVFSQIRRFVIVETQRRRHFVKAW